MVDNRTDYQRLRDKFMTICFILLMGGIVTFLWDVLVFCTPLRRWFRILPAFTLKGMCLGVGIFLCLAPFCYFVPSVAAAPQGPGFAAGFLGFFTFGMMLYILRVETKQYLYNLAAQIAAHQTYILANGGSIDGDPDGPGTGARPEAGGGGPPDLPPIGLPAFRLFQGWEPRTPESGQSAPVPPRPDLHQ